MKLMFLPIVALVALSLNSAGARAALPALAPHGPFACEASLLGNGVPINRGACCKFACNAHKCFCLWWC